MSDLLDHDLRLRSLEDQMAAIRQRQPEPTLKVARLDVELHRLTKLLADVVTVVSDLKAHAVTQASLLAHLKPVAQSVGGLQKQLAAVIASSENIRRLDAESAAHSLEFLQQHVRDWSRTELGS